MRDRLKKLFALTWFVALFGLALVKAQGCRTATPTIQENEVVSPEQEVLDMMTMSEQDLGAAREVDDGGDFDEPPGLIPATKSGPVMQRQSRRSP